MTEKLMTNCRAARMRYQSYLDEMAEKNKLRGGNDSKMCLQDAIREEGKKRKCLESSLLELSQEADTLALKAQETENFQMLRESNLKRQKIKEVQEAIDEASKMQDILKDQLQSL